MSTPTMQVTVTNCSSCQGSHEITFDSAGADAAGFTLRGRCPATGVVLFLGRDSKNVFVPFSTIYKEGDEVFDGKGWSPLADVSKLGQRNDRVLRRADHV